MHAIVLGAGVTGVTTAWYLRQSGFEVTVIDRQPAAGMETSYANGGQISVSHAEPWANPGAPLKVLKWLMKEDAPLLFRLRADPAQWRWGLQFLRECTPGRTAHNIRNIVNLGLYSREQLQRLRAATGIAYDQRMDELEKLEYPKPNREFIYSTFNAFAARHPWVGQENIRPKSIVREMFESFRSFSDYIRDYELQRAEGVLLRHLNSVFKVLTQTVPDAAKSDTLREMELYLGTMLRQVDASLLDEWERMRNPAYQRADTKEVRPPGADEAARDITRDAKAFTAAIRTVLFSFLRAWVNADADAALSQLVAAEDAEGTPWTAERLRAAMESFRAGHRHLCLDPEARNVRHTYVTPAEDKRTWRVQQMLVDPDAHNDWVAEFTVDLSVSRATGEPALRLVRIGSLG